MNLNVKPARDWDPAEPLLKNKTSRLDLLEAKEYKTLHKWH